MYNETVEFFCIDCRLCEKGGRRSIAGRVAKAALTGGLSLASDLGRALDSTSCSLCSHKETDHKKKIETPSFAFTPKGGEFDFGDDDGIAFRAVACVQAATSGGPALGPKPGQRLNVVFLNDRIEFCSLQGGGRLGSVNFSSLVALEVGGPGVQTRGGGFEGGGFGLAGFAVGVAAAGVLNLLTTRTSVQTLLRIQSSLSDGILEWVFLTDIDSPEAVSGVLRPITLHLQSRAESRARSAQVAEPATPAVVSGPPVDKVSRLKELAELRQAGVISEEEFVKMKSEILS